jgi:hypothetical protein
VLTRLRWCTQQRRAGFVLGPWVAPHGGMGADPPRAALIVFARLPVPGACKTRLAAGIGAEAAAHTYKLCAQAVFAAACG